MYQTMIQKFERAYKPYLDKARMERCIQEMKEEMEHLKTLEFQDKPSLFYGQRIWQIWRCVPLSMWKQSVPKSWKESKRYNARP